jgi:hypothetical protein
MKYTLLIATLLVFTFGCEKAGPTVEPQPVQATQPVAQEVPVAPVLSPLPDIRGHWTITFVQRRQTKDGSWMPGLGKNVGVLNVDLKDGVNVVIGEHGAECTQSGNQFSLNFLMMLDKDGKPDEACFTSVGSFDGSTGQLSHTKAVLAEAGYDIASPQNLGAENEKFPATTTVRHISLRIEFDHDSYRSTKIGMFDGHADVSSDKISGEWSDERSQGTFVGERTNDHATNPVATEVPQPANAPAAPLSADDELLVRKQDTWAKEYIDKLAHSSGRSVITSSTGSKEIGLVEKSASGQVVEPCKLRVTLHSASQWQSNYESDKQSSDEQSCAVNLRRMPEIAFEIHKIDVNGTFKGPVTLRTQATVSWLLSISDDKRVDCDADSATKVSGDKRQAYMSLSYATKSDATLAARSLKALIRNSCSQ